MELSQIEAIKNILLVNKEKMSDDVYTQLRNDLESRDARPRSRVARRGHLAVIKWERDNDCALDNYLCTAAAQSGPLELLKWVRENGCEWDKYLCAAAAKRGDLEMLKWARDNGCEWDESTCLAATRGKHLEVLKWVRENGCPEWEVATR